ncbi:hypothetical protein QTP88_018884 [Uroleucon formosanum]
MAADGPALNGRGGCKPQQKLLRPMRSFDGIYEADLPHSIKALRGELNLWKQFWKNKSEEADSSMKLLSMHLCFVTQNVLTILSVIPITTASAERSFNSLKRIITYLLTIMGQRLDGLVMLHINKDIQVKPEEVLYMFAKKHKRRLQFDL